MNETGAFYPEADFALRNPETIHLGSLVPSRVGDPDFADLAKEISETQEIEGASVTRVPAEPCTDAELSCVLAVVDQFASVRTLHSPDQLTVQEQFVQVLGIVVLPGHVMPLGVPNPRFLGAPTIPVGRFQG